MLPRLLFLVCCFVLISALDEGDYCQKDGRQGICTNLQSCQSALNDMEEDRQPKFCAMKGGDFIVCCLDKFPGPSATTTKSSPSITTEYIPPYDDDAEDSDEIFGYDKKCEPIPEKDTSPRTGQKAWDKCVDYQEKYIYPCKGSVSMLGGLTRKKICFHKTDALIVGGVVAQEAEFPHMVMIGFGDKPNLKWLCGGSIISENFILTAGHCISDRFAGNATHIVVRIHTRSAAETADDSKIYRIKRIVKHPEYKPPAKYNDIALFETDRPIELDSYTVPACLDTGKIPPDSATATGWGLTARRGDALSESLQKVILTKFTHQECQETFYGTRNMKNGVDSDFQLCYGDRTMSKDTCQGDSGGPLQIMSTDLSCMYIVIGVTSLGKDCGFVGDPGIYTRVSAYVPWIESVVWP